MNKALFTRKAVDIDELKRQTGSENEKVPFVIEKIIELPADKFLEVCDNLLCDYDFIKENIELMFIDSNGVWHCCLIKSESGLDGILCEVEGYSYLRYSNYILDCTAILEELKSNIITDKIKEQIVSIKNSGVCNMFDIVAVQREAFEKGYNELIILIEENKKAYSNFILTGR